MIFAAKVIAESSRHGVLHYWLIVALMMTGIYLILSKSNMIKTIIGLNLFQVSVIMFYVSMGKVQDGTAPILMGKDVEHEHHVDAEKGGHGLLSSEKPVLVDTLPTKAKKLKNPPLTISQKQKGKPYVISTRSKKTKIIYSNPLPHVLMLTAIVVGVATTALALSLVVRINEHFGTIEEDELEEKGALS